MGFEGGPKHPKRQDREAHEQAHSAANVRKRLEEAAETLREYAPLHADLAALPETNRPLRYEVGEKVQYPTADGDPTLSQWQIVHGIKSHYVLERAAARGGFDQVLCSEDELLNHNPR